MSHKRMGYVNLFVRQTYMKNILNQIRITNLFVFSLAHG